MARARALVWSSRAKQDLRDIWRYYARIASPDIADRMVRDIAEGAERLTENPLPGRARNELREGLRSLLVHPHTLFYCIRDDEAQVIRVLHERRDFPNLFAEGDK